MCLLMMGIIADIDPKTANRRRAAKMEASRPLRTLCESRRLQSAREQDVVFLVNVLVKVGLKLLQQL